MLLFIALSNLVCLLLPALIAARVTPREDPVNLAAHQVKRLSTPLKNLPHKRDAVLFTSTPNAPGRLALNSTNENLILDTILFDAQIGIPGIGRAVYFHVIGVINEDYSVRVEFWIHYDFDRRIGIFHGDLLQGVDLKKIPRGTPRGTAIVFDGEARLYAMRSGPLDILVFEAYGSVPPLSPPGETFPPFKKHIISWRAGDISSIQDVPNNSGVLTLSNNAGADTSFSVE